MRSLGHSWILSGDFESQDTDVHGNECGLMSQAQTYASIADTSLKPLVKELTLMYPCENESSCSASSYAVSHAAMSTSSSVL